jgi:hypothetical protein
VSSCLNFFSLSAQDREGNWEHPDQQHQEEERPTAAQAASVSVMPKTAMGPTENSAPVPAAPAMSETTVMKESVVHIFILRCRYLRRRVWKVLALRVKES